MTEVESSLEREISASLLSNDSEPVWRKLKEGETLVEQGEPGDELYLLFDGSSKYESTANRLVRSGPGSLLGERALLEGGRRKATP